MKPENIPSGWLWDQAAVVLSIMAAILSVCAHHPEYGAIAMLIPVLMNLIGLRLQVFMIKTWLDSLRQSVDEKDEDAP